jgi:hypothetical protein
VPHQDLVAVPAGSLGRFARTLGRVVNEDGCSQSLEVITPLTEVIVLTPRGRCAVEVDLQTRVVTVQTSVDDASAVFGAQPLPSRPSCAHR